MTSPQRGQPLLDELCDSIRAAYGSKPPKAIEQYASVLFHECAHALMAFELQVKVMEIRVDPASDYGNVKLGGEAEFMFNGSVVEAKIFLAAPVAELLFQGCAVYEPCAWLHDVWLAFASLRFGPVGAEVIQGSFKERQRTCKIYNRTTIREMMQAAHRDVKESSPRYVESKLSSEDARDRIAELLTELAAWVQSRMPTLKAMVAELARRRRKGPSVDGAQLIRAVLRQQKKR